MDHGASGTGKHTVSSGDKVSGSGLASKGLDLLKEEQKVCTEDDILHER